MIDYWHFTGDETYNDETFAAMQFQVGKNRDYAPDNWTLSLGNDDQSFWGMSAMLAAEVNFRDPTGDDPSWLGLAQAVWTEQSTRYSNEDCGGGLRWQIFSTNKGYDYKNSKAFPPSHVDDDERQRDSSSERLTRTDSHRQRLLLQYGGPPSSVYTERNVCEMGRRDVELDQ